ncbi:hypothetical protein [Streptomyces sp. NPDC059783]|uniref:hypothetical protein n=1 Tax=Streptomyces sp. NPDC059783 TaxID=3346944 RepID=UPI003649ABC8
MEEAFRVPLPVPTDGTGGWSLVDRRLGVVGQGTAVARIDEKGKVLWRTTLPAAFALTGRPGGPHATSAPPYGTLTLVGAAEHGRFPSLGTIDPATGVFTRLTVRPPRRPAGTLRLIRVTSSPGTRYQVIAATCLPGDLCTLTSWDGLTGKVLWTRHPHGPAVFAEPCSRSSSSSPSEVNESCDPLVLVADGRLVMLRGDEEKPLSRPLRLPPGDIGQVIRTLYRVIVTTVPHAPDCRARAAAYDADSPAAAPVWQRTFTWNQPQAPLRDGCRYDPSIPLIQSSDLVLPDAAGALIGDDYHGTFPRRLDPGEYPVAHRNGIVAHRPDGTYRTLGPAFPEGARPRPRKLTPDAQSLRNGLWYLPGTGRHGEILALDSDNTITWHLPSSGPPFLLTGDRLVYPEGGELVGVRSVG